MNGSEQCTYAKSNGYIPLGDTVPFGTGERIFCLYQEPLAIKWVHCWSFSFYLLRDKEINRKDTVKTVLMKNSLIWTTLDFFYGYQLSYFYCLSSNSTSEICLFCFRKRFDRLYTINM